MKIYAPVKDANGIYASVRFVNGVGETTNPALIEWFRKHGYRVGESNDQVADKGKKVEVAKVTNEKVADVTKVVESTEVTEVAKDGKPDFESMTSDEIRSWAKEKGLGGIIKNTRNKDKLLELIRG